MAESGGVPPLDKGKANVSLRGNSLGKGNVAKRQKDCCPAKDSRPWLRVALRANTLNVAGGFAP